MPTMLLERGWRTSAIMLALLAAFVPAPEAAPLAQGAGAGATGPAGDAALAPPLVLAPPLAPAPTPAVKVSQPVMMADQTILTPSSGSVDRKSYFVIHNSSDKEMEIGSITVIDTVGTRADEKAALPPGSVTMSCGVPSETPRPPYRIRPFSSCTVAIELPDQGPGVFEAKVLVQGGSAGERTVPLKFDIKRSRSWAFSLVLLGLVVGGFVSWWRSTGRAQWQDAARVKAALEAIAALDNHAGMPRRLLGLAGGANDLQTRILAGDSYEPEAIAELEQRVGYARYFLIEEQRAGATIPGVSEATSAAIEMLDPVPGTGLLPPVPPANVTAAGAAIKAAATGAGIAPASAIAGALISSSTPSIRIRRVGAVIEFLTAAAAALVFAVVAMPTLYDGQPHWGSFGDQLAAFLLGFGAFAGSMAAVSTFIAKARPKAA